MQKDIARHYSPFSNCHTNLLGKLNLSALSPPTSLTMIPIERHHSQKSFDILPMQHTTPSLLIENTRKTSTFIETILPSSRRSVQRNGNSVISLVRNGSRYKWKCIGNAIITHTKLLSQVFGYSLLDSPRTLLSQHYD